MGDIFIDERNLPKVLKKMTGSFDGVRFTHDFAKDTYIAYYDNGRVEDYCKKWANNGGCSCCPYNYDKTPDINMCAIEEKIG